MKQIRVLRGSVVVLVKVPEFLSVISRPNIGEYENPYILEVLPCEKVNGEYFNLLTGEIVVREKDTLEWNALSGTVFYYPQNAKRLLISKRFSDGKLLLFSVNSSDITNTMILRKVFKREKKKKY